MCKAIINFGNTKGMLWSGGAPDDLFKSIQKIMRKCFGDFSLAIFLQNSGIDCGSEILQMYDYEYDIDFSSHTIMVYNTINSLQEYESAENPRFLRSEKRDLIEEWFWEDGTLFKK